MFSSYRGLLLCDKHPKCIHFNHYVAPEGIKSPTLTINMAPMNPMSPRTRHLKRSPEIYTVSGGFVSKQQTSFYIEGQTTATVSGIFLSSFVEDNPNCM